jgi:hypothetical protein
MVIRLAIDKPKTTTKTKLFIHKHAFFAVLLLIAESVSVIE